MGYDVIKNKIILVLKTITKKNKIDISNSLVHDLSMDSFDMVNFEHEMSKLLNLSEIDTDKFLEAKTVGDFCKFYSDEVKRIK